MLLYMNNMRRFLFLLTILILAGAGCSIGTPDTPKVGATIFPIYDLVRVIGQEEIDAVLILPPGASPHNFEPTPSVIKALQGSSLIFQIGHGLDSWTTSISQSIPRARVVTLDRNIQLLPTADIDEHTGEEEEDHEHGPIDPHYWMDPTNAYIMIDTIVDELSQIDPAHAELFVARANTFKDELERKDYEWMQKMAEVPNKKIVTFHDAFNYFAQRFQFQVVATFEPFPGREPTPQYLIDLKNNILKYNVKTLYVEPQFPTAALETFAKDNDLSIATLDPEGSSDRTSYLEMIGYNVETIIQNQK